MKPINLKNAMAAYATYWKNWDAYIYAREHMGVSMPERYQMGAQAAQEELDAELEKIAPAIAAVEGRATARCINPRTILDELTNIERKLDISKKAMDGIKVHVNHNAQKFPAAYKYTPMATYFSAEYKNGSWRLINVSRDTCNNTRWWIDHTDASKEALIARFTRG